MVVEEEKNTRIRILLIFSTDGVLHAENIVTGLENFSIQVPVRLTLVLFNVVTYLFNRSFRRFRWISSDLTSSNCGILCC